MFKLVVLLTTLAVSWASIIPGPLAYSTSSIVHGGPALIPGIGHYGFASLPHHAPAVVLGPNGVPLDTPEVVAARAAHLQAKALAGAHAHILKKRSLAWGLPAASSWTSRVDLPGPAVYASPVVLGHGPLALGPAPLGHAPLGLGHGLGFGLGHGW